MQYSQNASPFPTFPLPFNKEFRKRSISALGTPARAYIVGGLGKWLSSHIAMRFREIQGLAHDDPLDGLVLQANLISARNTEEFLELFGMAELMFRCQNLPVCRGKMARFFRIAGHALYVSREEVTCIVQYGRVLASMKEQEQVIPFTSHIQVYPCISEALSMQDANSNCEIRAAVSIGVQCDPNVECNISLPGTRPMSDHEVQTDQDILDLMSVDANVECSVELPGSRSMSHHEVQTDHDIQASMAVDDTNVKCFVELSGSRSMSHTEVQTENDKHDQMALEDPNVKCSVESLGSRSMSDHEVQTDIDVQDCVVFDNSNIGMYEPMVEFDSAESLQRDVCMTEEYDVGVSIFLFLHCH